MTNTVIPTHGLRWLKYEPTRYTGSKILLQQRVETLSGKELWVDIPVVDAKSVEETEDGC